MAPTTDPNSSDERLKFLLTKREQIKAKASRIQEFVRNVDPNTVTNMEEIITRKTSLENCLQKFEDNEFNLALEYPDQVNGDTEASQFERDYFSTMAVINNILNKREITTPEQTERINSNTNINLPSLKLPTFSGAYTEWLSFYDTFNHLVHRDERLTDCQKFHYLKSCLTGEALRAVESLAISNANYNEAYSILETRFKNERLIVQDHIYAILNFPAINKSADSSTLRQLLDNFNVNYAALQSLKLPVKTWDGILVPIITSKLDYNTKREWESKLEKDLPKLDDLKVFLEKRCQFLESVSSSNKMHQNNNQVNKPVITNQKNRYVAHVVTQNSKLICTKCKKNHNIYQCPEFLSLSINDRKEYARLNKLCFNCLRDNHQLNACKSNSSCKECKSKHHSLLHTGIKIHEPSASTSTAVYFCGNQNKSVLLSTAIVLVKTKFNEIMKCRALLDMGSQSHFITENMCKRLGLQTEQLNLAIVGVNATSSYASRCASITLSSQYSSYSTKIKCCVIEKITENLPLESLNLNSLDIPPNIKLADPKFYESGPIDLLIGAELFWQLLLVGSITESVNRPHFQESKLGWLAGGSVNVRSERSSTTCHSTTWVRDLLEQNVSKFWELEEICHKHINSQEDQDCEKHFQETVRRQPDGRFIVSLPFKTNKIDIGNSRIIAEKRFYSLERKLNRQPNVKNQYQNFLDEYEQLGHMELMDASELENINHCYLPHHPVIKETAVTTKLRVVFNASAKTSNGKSLNDNLMIGPNLQQELFAILLRFRTYKYVISGDIEKMYRQININPEDAMYQLILWRSHPNQPLNTYKLTTVTYGTSSAPYLAMRCLKQLAIENKEHFPLACKNILENFYMDDLLCGANTLEEAATIQREIVNILAQGQFYLHKWSSNNSALIPTTSSNQCPDSIVTLDKIHETKTLGLIWNPKNDQLNYKINLINTNTTKITKRTILSITTQIFDPLGLITPLVIKAKIILQQLWSTKLDWDERVPENIEKAWVQFIRELSKLTELSIPRNVFAEAVMNPIEIHDFSDASTQGYGAAIYVKVKQTCPSPVTLLCAKSRVAPLKTISLPRLELLGALLLARLLTKVTEALKLPIDNCYLWTDSTIVLNWISAAPHTWQTFVANRVSEIQSLTSNYKWQHVRSSDNPADIITRGMFPDQLIKSHLWWHGPTWLSQDASLWPKFERDDNKTDTPEKRKIILNNVVQPKYLIFNHHSSFTKIQRIIAWCYRFIHNTRNKNQKHSTEFLTITELKKAHDAIISNIQREAFSAEIENLTKGKPINRNSRLISLDPFLSSDGLLHVGGRLKNGNFNYNTKHPIILPNKHHITNLIIRQEHEYQLHAGPQATLANLRLKYWPINARNLTRKICKNCITCFKVNPKTTQPKMSNLPPERLEPLRPFLRVGIDYGGPILIKQGNKHSKKTVKAYIALFICFATKAIHLELVSDLSTEAFWATLTRFFSRRGNVLDIFSDNATNFVGAHRYMKELSLFLKSKEFNQITEKLAQKNTKWHFIPAKSPHMGGLWEAGIKTVKSHIKKICGNALLTFEELYTLLTQIEACVNSRPLTPLTSDPEDFTPLTPGHFLIGEPLTAPIERDLQEVKVNRLTRWERIKQLQQHFWTRWTKEFLHQLQQRRKWQSSTSTSADPAIGDLVLLKEENLPPLQWKTGRIVDLHPGSDGTIRVVSIKTPTGITKRAVNRICVLPINDNSESEVREN